MPARTGTIRLTGQVLDPAGRPVGGADVFLAPHPPARDVIVQGQKPSLPTVRTRSDDHGLFEFRGVAPGTRRLAGHHPEHSPGWTEPFEVRSDDHRVLRLPAPLFLTGRVEPPSARLSAAVRVPGLDGPGRGPVLRAAYVGPRGRYRLGPLPPDTAFNVQAEARGYKRETFGPLRFAAGEASRDFTLERGLTLSGVVRTPSGVPVAGATVAWRGDRTETDSSGAYALEGLEDRAGTLVVTREGHVSAALSDVRPGERVVVLPLAAEVSGRVPEGEGLFICFSSGNERYRTMLGAGGAFRLTGVPPGRVRLEVEDAAGRPRGEIDLELSEGERRAGLAVPLRR